METARRDPTRARPIEHVAAARAEPELWRRQSFLRHAGYGLFGSHFHLAIGMAPPDDEDTHERDWGGERALDWQQAYDGVAGMLRFGGREGAELYRALGELFLAERHLHLAWWSFRRAIERDHPAAEQLADSLRRITDHQTEAERHDSQGNVPPTEALYRQHRDSADRWLAAFQELEAAAIARGEDAGSDAVLARLLAEADRREPRPALPTSLTYLQWLWIGIGIALVALSGAWCLDRRRTRAAAA